MQSEKQKITNLLYSKDIDNVRLGLLALSSKINSSNVLYWYMTLGQISKEVSPELQNKMSDLLGWNAEQTPMEHMQDMVTYMQSKKVDLDSVSKFFEYYNNYLFNLISHKWKVIDRINVKEKIPALNVSEFTAKLNEDL